MRLQRKVQQLEEEAGVNETKTRLYDSKVNALEAGAKELQEGLDALSIRGKAKDGRIVELENRVEELNEETKKLTRARDQALLDARRALSSINSSGKTAREAQREKEMAEEDRDAAYTEMELARVAQLKSEELAAEAISVRDRLLAEKSAVEAQAVDNERLRTDIHNAHEAQTRAEADRFAAQEAKATAEADSVAARAALANAEAVRDAALQAQISAESALASLNKELAAKEAALADAEAKIQAIETSRQQEIHVWKLRATEAEEAREMAEDKVMQTTQKLAGLGQKLNEVFSGYSAAQAEVEALREETEIQSAALEDLRNQLENEQNRVERAEKELEDAAAAQTELKKELEAARDAAMQSAEEQILDVRRALESKIAEADATIKTLEGDLEASRKEAEEMNEGFLEATTAAEAEKETLQKELESAHSDLKIVEGQLTDAEKAHRDAVAAEAQRREIAEAKAADAEATIKSIEAELEAARGGASDNLEKLSKKVALANSEKEQLQEDLITAQNDLKAAQAQLVEVQKELAAPAAPKDTSELDAEVQRREAAEKKLAAIKEELKVANAARENAESQLAADQETATNAANGVSDVSIKLQTRIEELSDKLLESQARASASEDKVALLQKLNNDLLQKVKMERIVESKENTPAA